MHGRDITLYKRHCGSTIWEQVWTEIWTTPADERAPTRRGFEPPSIVIDNDDPEDCRLHVVVQGIDNVADSVLQHHYLRHFVFDLDDTTGDLISATPVQEYDLGDLAIHLPRWGMCASQLSRYIYVAGPECGTAYRDQRSDTDPRNKTIRILRCDPGLIGTSFPWTQVQQRFCLNGQSTEPNRYHYVPDGTDPATGNPTPDIPDDLADETRSDLHALDSDIPVWTTQRTIGYCAAESYGHRL
ncbi:MAG: hypothetical protein DYG94_06810 [Leptolyngbya sp. PLA3]|nr:MAG: hypothetical protein EDM82_06155 [Cyanobacteria bacterium CYA]MCE7968439.1 hypothetical protein [Leptolyngbya sp. PL-A3]